MGGVSMHGRLTSADGVQACLEAATDHGLEVIIVPEDNRQDIANLPPRIRRNIEINTAATVEEALSKALAPPMPDEAEADAKSADRESDPHHSVYVVELSDEAGARRNPDYPNVYIGMTGLPIEERFRRHKAGLQASRWVQRYGIRLRPDLYSEFGAMPYAEAARLERELPRRLEERGFTVFGGH